MSAEGKKKRGESGLSNAKNAPFRLNGGGLYPMYMRHIMGEPGRRVGRPQAGSAYDKPIVGIHVKPNQG
jgi:hypothetical protein